jgi:hypothetical protein
MQWSGGLPYWSVLPRERARFEDTCQQFEPGIGAGSHWCPALRETLWPGLPRRPRIAGGFMGLFQSLGDNCEFGMAQRWAREENLDLMRFASFWIPVEDRLRETIRALTDGFSGLGDPDSVTLEPRGEKYPREYVLRETRWNLSLHTGAHESGIDAELIRRRQIRALQFRRRKLLEDLETAHRVFVWKCNLPTSERDIRDLVACLRRYGPNLLLWVSVADEGHPAGFVEYAGDGLLKGYVARFATYDDATDADFMSWNEMCRNAAAKAEDLRRAGEWSSPGALAG